MSDTWEYDGTTWVKSSITSPPARSVHAMVYDAGRKRTVVFGGMGARRSGESPPILDDTWEFDGTAWSQRQVAGPPPRLGAGSAYDSKRGIVLIIGGANHERVFNDLWSWDGTAWRKLAEGGPEARVMGYIAYDKNRDRVVLFGGRRHSPDNTDLADTWEWDGAAWRRVGRPAQSARKDTLGSTRAARSAGTRLAATATTRRVAATSANVAGSRSETW